MRPVVLAVLDGFGIGTGEDPTAGADTPFFDRARRLYPQASLEASGRAVGIPDGLMGNSEIGHMTLGAGRIIDQDIVRIQKALDAGELERNEVFTRLLRTAADGPGRLHLLGLVSDGGVHSSLEHLEAILEATDRRGLAPILHAFTDGRDTPPRSALQWLAPLERRLTAMGGGIATVSGRYYGMDRDQRWDRIALAYRAVTERDGIKVATAVEAVEKGYRRDEGDEFIQPSVVGTTPGLSDGEVALFFNFRADRARELTNVITRERPELLGPEVEALARIRLAALATWTAYDTQFRLPTVFPPIEVPASLGEVLSLRGLKQLRIAETEKYAHVTYFFSCGREEPFSGEDRILIPSPRDVATYDLKPEMSAVEVTDRLIEALEHEDYAFVLVNYANPDMVGHTGIQAAAIRAIEVVDACLDRVCQAVLARGGTVLITSDHGNVERMIDPETGSPHTAHTTNRVPITWVVDPPTGTVQDGGLADVAPSLCLLLNLEVPAEMTGRCLISDPSS
ncbi:MAG: 2,3-bisphosphoglycerate-independent phosphoglycerate mutase [Myxococcota bacterium]